MSTDGPPGGAAHGPGERVIKPDGTTFEQSSKVGKLFKLNNTRLLANLLSLTGLVVWRFLDYNC